MDNIFHENEIKTNRIAGKTLTAFSGILLLFALLGFFNVLDMGGPWCCALLSMSAIAATLLHMLACAARNGKIRARHYIIAEALILSGISYFLYPSRIHFLFFGPILMSIMYFDAVFIVKVSLASWLVYSAALWLNVLLSYCSPWMNAFHYIQGLDILSYPIDTFKYMYAPGTLLYLITYYIAKRISQNGKMILKKQTEITAAAAKNASELEAAAHIQRLSMSSTERVSPNGSMRVSAFLQPAKAVGGDFFDHFMVTDNLMVMLVADVSDKGLPSAMFAMRAQSILRFALTAETGQSTPSDTGRIDLEKAVNLANGQISRNNRDSFFVTMCLCCVDCRTGIGQFVNAGHLPPVIRHGDGTTEMLTNEPQLFLGLDGFDPLRTGVFQLRKGDSLILYTDGATDAENPKGEMLGFDAFRHILENVRTGDNPCGEITSSTVQSLFAHIDTADQFDDITLLTATYTGEDSSIERGITVTADDAGLESALSFVNSMLAEVHCPEDTRRNMDAVIDDVFTNIEDHAYDGGSGSIGITCKCDRNYVKMAFSDSGPAFDPTAVPAPDPDGEPQIGGMGIFLIRSLTDAMEYRREGNRNILTLTEIWNM